MMLSLVVVFACSSAPQLNNISPNKTISGQPISLTGHGLTAGARAHIIHDETEELYPLYRFTIASPLQAEGILPWELPAGSFHVLLEQDGKKRTLKNALHITPSTEQPCSNQFRSNTQLSLARGEVLIDRFYADERRQTLLISLSEIERVDYELVALDETRMCSVVLLRKGDGTRVIFEDDEKIDLERRAARMARDLGKELMTTRLDSPGIPTTPSE